MSVIAVHADLIDGYNVGHVVNSANSNNNKNDEPTNIQHQQQPTIDNDDINQTKLSLQQKSSEYKTLQSKLSSKLQTIQTVRDTIKYDRATLLTSYTQNDKLYTDMDIIGTKVIELVRRSERVVNRIKEYNVLELKGVSQKEAIENEISMMKKGLKERLESVREEELKRRDRYYAVAAAATSMNNESGVEEEDQVVCTEDAQECPDGSWVGRDSMNDCNFYPCDEEEGDSSESEDDDEESSDDDHDTESTSSSPYITKNQLSQLLNPQNVISKSESTLQTSLSNLATQLLEEQIRSESNTFRKRSKSLPNEYKQQFNTIKKSQLQKEEQRSNNNVCLSISKSIEIVSKALVEHYYDGVVGLEDELVEKKDHANYENGGSVVYELTSLSYVPPPRNNDDNNNNEEGAASYVEMEKQKMYDEQMETMYYQQQRRSSLHQGGTTDDGQTSSSSTWNKINQVLEQINVYKWYTTFKFDKLRPYLPEDWERVLDTLSHRTTTTGGSSWDEYTPRGAMDALIPDYLYHALGLHGLGRTVSPEVAISSSGNGGVSGGGGWMAKPMGQCYPLSMRSEDDPALSLLSRGVMDFDKNEEQEADSSLIIGPKYTVRLPYPIHVDAVTLEHRSFPLPKSMLENDGLRGGESAPRWVRVVGYPPCSQGKSVHHHNDDGDEECGVRGFDITKPIDLGTFEYQRITVTGREDDYGGGSSNSDGDVEEESGNSDPFSGGKRRRSIQTFAVKGGKWKPSSLLEEEGISEDDDDEVQQDEEEYDSLDARQCSDGTCEEEDGDPSYDGWEEEETDQESSLPEPGQCAPPKDEDSVPSCGGEMDNTSQDTHERQIVEAVSFIIEENWGNSEYTCLYRVRVHGDAV